MPVTVKHGGGDIGGLALLALLAGTGQQQAPQAPQISGIGGPLSGGGGGRGGRSRRPRTRPARDTLEQVRQIELDAAMEQKRQEARHDASQWESKYSAKQRQEIAGFNQARQDIAKNPRFSPEEKARMTKAVDLQQMNIEPQMVLRDPNKPSPEEIEKMRTPFVDQNTGALMGYTMRNGVVTPTVLTQPDKMPEEIEKKRKFDFQAKREEAILTARAEMISEEVLDVDENGVVRLDREGNPRKRQRTPEELNRDMRMVRGIREQWYHKLEDKGWTITDADRSLPAHIGYAQAHLRMLIETYGSLDLAPREQAADINKYRKILKDWQTLRYAG